MLPDIGLTGLAGAGKDTVGKLLVKRYGYGRVGFADGVRALLLKVNPQIGSLPLSAYLGAPGWNFEGEPPLTWDELKEDPEIRRMLQILGHGAREIAGDDVWIRSAFKRAHETCWSVGRPCVFTDVRYLNEAEAIEGSSCGIIVRVVRPGAGLEGFNGAHVTETEQADIMAHYTIENSGTLDDLADAVDTIVSELRTFSAA